MLQSYHTNLSGPEGVRHTVHEGRDTLVVPVVMIVEGVLNGALLSTSEFGKHVESWNDVPVPVLHPEERGQPISAKRPDVIARTIGRVYNARVDGDKLKAELWIDVEKAKRLGFGELLRDLDAGKTVEVSTGYFSDDLEVSGEMKGAEYTTQHINIKPDHLALLPGQIGACSVADGCGTRVNQRQEGAMSVELAYKAFAKAMGLRTHCNCQQEGETVTDKMKAMAEQLKQNEKLTPEQFDMIMGMDPEQLAMLEALIEAAKAPAAPAPEGDDPEGMEGGKPEGEQPDGMAVNIKTMASQVLAEVERQQLVAKLVTNQACPLEAADLEGLSVNALKKLEVAHRPADYSGMGGYTVNAAHETNGNPVVPPGFAANRRAEGGK